ncbi:MAG TPA: Rossmann-like and DUF2520 domain-containing protein [Limnochordia bacterium]|jgi:Uncharacterized conserved protein|nr:Rossmann-like and DUF2520 domain-containing protein [Limnochordia bacterium]
MYPPVAIIGAGRVGTAIGALLHRRGHPIRGVVRRTHEKAEEAVRLIGAGTPTTDPVEGARGAEIILITVPDGAIHDMAAVLGAGLDFGPAHLLIHTSGALPADALRAPGTERALLLSLHPIQTIAHPGSAEQLAGSAFGLEGEPEAIARGRELVAAMGGVALVIKPGQKALYHAASCVASNYLVALVEASLELFELAGIPKREALKAVGGLLQGTIDNLERLGIPGALTGPIERGDVETIRRHLKALGRIGEEKVRGRLKALYRTLGLETLHVAAQKPGGLTERHRAIRDLLMGLQVEKE